MYYFGEFTFNLTSLPGNCSFTLGNLFKLFKLLVFNFTSLWNIYFPVILLKNTWIIIKESKNWAKKKKALYIFFFASLKIPKSLLHCEILIEEEEKIDLPQINYILL